jgi:Fur family transcriptional regulator, ferric uptake regulator
LTQHRLRRENKCEKLKLMASVRKPRKDEEIRQLLSTRKLRVTEQRMAILRELSLQQVPVSHPELTQRLAGTQLDRVTVYRNLLSLTQVGLLVRTQLGDKVWRYSFLQDEASTHDMHPHFICILCGVIQCLPASAVSFHTELVCNEIAEVQLRGRCVACAQSLTSDPVLAEPIRVVRFRLAP